MPIFPHLPPQCCYQAFFFLTFDNPIGEKKGISFCISLIKDEVVCHFFIFIHHCFFINFLSTLLEKEYCKRIKMPVNFVTVDTTTENSRFQRSFKYLTVPGPTFVWLAGVGKGDLISGLFYVPSSTQDYLYWYFHSGFKVQAAVEKAFP